MSGGREGATCNFDFVLSGTVHDVVENRGEVQVIKHSWDPKKVAALRSLAR